MEQTKEAVVMPAAETVAEPLPAVKQERNLGIEVFRIVSMILICLLHVLGQGGVLSHSGYLSTNYKIGWYLETLGYCSVNCYALISGYANIKSNFKYRRLVYLWLEVFAITVSTTVITALFTDAEVTRWEWLCAFFPLTLREYWYFNAYFLMFFFIPIMNKGILALKKWQHQLTMVALFVVTTVLRLVEKTDNFALGGGYSCMWLMVLYVFGAYFRLYGFPKFAKWYVTLPVFFGAAAIAWWEMIRTETLVMEGVIARNSEQAKNAGYLISYLSPCMVIMALALMAFCARIQVKRKVPKVIVSNLGKASFGVFLVHVGSMGWYHFLGSRYAEIGGLVPWKMVLATLGVTIVFYLGCSLYSLARVWLFKLARVHKGVDFVVDHFAGLIEKHRAKKKALAENETALPTHETAEEK